MTSSFPQNLRRIAGDRSVTKLAEETGIGHSSISRYLSGKRSPTADQIKQLAESLDVSADELLGVKRRTPTHLQEAA
jgi:transcriptional regulator with XRE-family HTH domain